MGQCICEEMSPKEDGSRPVVLTAAVAASTDAKGGSDDTARGGGGVAGDKLQCSSSPMFLAPELQLEAVTKSRWRRPSSWGCATKRRAALVPAVCLAVAVAIVVLFAGGGMPEYSFFHDARDLEDIPPGNLTADHLLDGLLTADFSYRSCRSRYDFAGYHKKKSSHKPSPYLIAKLRNQEALQKRCGPGTAAYKKALRRLDSGEGAATDAGDDDCRYLVNISFRGLGNRMLAVASAFLYAVLTERVLLVHWGKRRGAADLFCEPFPGATWLLPSPGWRSRLRNIDDYDGDTNESLGNMLQRGAAIASADGNLSWASPAPPPYVYLHLSGGYGFHDKLFYCGEHQRLLRSVPWLLMRTDSYLVPGLFLTPPFAGELDAMFPEKDAAFHHLGRYLFHPSNAAWSAVTSYYRSNLAGAGRRVGIQIRVFQKKQPPQVVLDQLLSCVRNEKLLPEITVTATNDTSAQPNDAVLVTSLSSWYSERIRAEYGGRIAGGVHQPSHEGEQRWGDASHDMRALSEIYLLSMSDVLVTSGFSTFGYVAQGLAGLQPWVMPRQSMWDEWKEGQAAEQPCRRALSVEPCFHSPSYYDCAAKRDVELDKVRPYIRRCEDVSWGIKLVNESGSQW